MSNWFTKARYSRVEAIALCLAIGGLLSLALMGCQWWKKPVLEADPVEDTGVCEDTGQPEDPKGMT